MSDSAPLTGEARPTVFSRPTARELDRAADVALKAFWHYVRVVRDEEPPDDLWDQVCLAMGMLSDIVDRRCRS